MALGAALLSSAACGALLGRSGGRLRYGRHSEFQGKSSTWTVDSDTHCGKMEVDVEYKDEASGFGKNFDHIPSPELCCALCQAEPRCKSFTWVKDAGLDGNPSQCWIKGGIGDRVAGYGKVSGVPPARPTLGTVPSGRGTTQSLFCFALMMPYGSESNLLAFQWQKQASIFACDAYSVYSNTSIQIAASLTTKVVDSNLQCKYGGDSNTALNSWIFIAVWDKVIDDGLYKSYKWTVKVDPDCVFFPDRLGPILQANDQAGYINNCKYGMHGPIEVFNVKALDALAADYSASQDGKAPKRCVTEQHFGMWGEDMFIDQCLSKVLGVTERPTEAKLVCEDHCDCPEFFWCRKGGDVVSYHPMKTVGAYEMCLGNALSQNPGTSAAISAATAAAQSSATYAPEAASTSSDSYSSALPSSYGAAPSSSYGAGSGASAAAPASGGSSSSYGAGGSGASAAAAPSSGSSSSYGAGGSGASAAAAPPSGYAAAAAAAPSPSYAAGAATAARGEAPAAFAAGSSSYVTYGGGSDLSAGGQAAYAATS